jgi:hypothetical protein
MLVDGGGDGCSSRDATAVHKESRPAIFQVRVTVARAEREQEVGDDASSRWRRNGDDDDDVDDNDNKT